MFSLLNNKGSIGDVGRNRYSKMPWGVSWGCGDNQDTQDSDFVARCPSVLPREPHRPPASFAADFRVLVVNGVLCLPDWKAIFVSYIISS
jgi:hypothetical protein